MTASISVSNAPDEDLLERVAGALGVEAAFVEKDWFVVHAIEHLAGAATDDLKPVFSGGTSLLKDHQLIRRFSEDIDFKLELSEELLAKSQGQKKSALSAFKKSLVDGWSEAGFTVTEVKAGSGNAFIRIDMDYPTRLEPRRIAAATHPGRGVGQAAAAADDQTSADTVREPVSRRTGRGAVDRLR